MVPVVQARPAAVHEPAGLSAVAGALPYQWYLIRWLCSLFQLKAFMRKGHLPTDQDKTWWT